MIAACHLEAAAHIRILAGLYILHPRAVDADRHLVLGFARHAAGVAANALALIDQEAVIGHGRLKGAETPDDYTGLGGATAFMMALAKSWGDTPGD